MAFVMDRKLFAGVNAILQISSSELNRRLMIKSADSFRMRRHSGPISSVLPIGRNVGHFSI
jgi:hypothetical protein